MNPVLQSAENMETGGIRLRHAPTRQAPVLREAVTEIEEALRQVWREAAQRWRRRAAEHLVADRVLEAGEALMLAVTFEAYLADGEKSEIRNPKSEVAEGRE